MEPVDGTWPPADGQIVIEQSSLPLVDTNRLEVLTIKTSNGAPQDLLVAGIVRDVGLAPGWMEHKIYGYVTGNTLERLGKPSHLDQLEFVVADDPATAVDESFDEIHIRRTAARLERLIEDDGRQVHDVFVPPPGRHIHAEQMDSFLYLQAMFGFLALALSGVLVVNFMSAILSGQVREIGMMKSVGARTGQIAATYVTMVLLLGLIASALAIPPALLIGRSYANFTAGLLNFDVTGYAVPGWALALQAAVGLLLPIAAASVPIYRGARVTVSRAVRDYGIDESAFGGSALDRALGRVSGTTRPLLLSLRNTLRRRTRLALTLVTLAMGGAIFLGALNLRASIRQSVATMYDAIGYDVVVGFGEPYPRTQIEQIVPLVPGVASLEMWGQANAALVSPDGMHGNAFPMIAPPVATELVAYPIVEGRWLVPGDSNALVVNNQVIDQQPQLRVGEQVMLSVNGAEGMWEVVGVVISSPNAPAAYAAADFLEQYSTQRTAMVVTDSHDAGSQAETAQLLQRALETHGMEVSSIQSVEAARAVMEDHMLMAVNLLWVMSFVILAVGGLGLATTMSLAVLERTREIGVMRAVGAAHHTILGIVLIEGILIGVLSWAIAVPTSFPMNTVLGDTFGIIMFQAPLTFSSAPAASIVWLVAVVLLSALASLWPSLRAVRITTSEALWCE